MSEPATVVSAIAFGSIFLYMLWLIITSSVSEGDTQVKQKGKHRK